MPPESRNAAIPGRGGAIGGTVEAAWVGALDERSVDENADAMAAAPDGNRHLR